MQQHPVPQHISSYEFKLVGDMTLKQFFQLAGGITVSLIFYATPLPGVIKWPLVLLFGLLGAALAFLPIEERPLSQWFLAFIKAVYSPTLYTWDANSAEDVFAKSTSVDTTPTTLSATNSDLTGAGQSEEVKKFEQGERNFFSKVSAMFAVTPQATNSVVNTTFNQNTALGGVKSSAEPFTQGMVLTQEVQGQKTSQQAASNMRSVRPEDTAMPVPVQQVVKVGHATPIQNLQVDQQETIQPLSPVFANQGGNGQVIAQAVFSPEAAPPSPPEIPNTIVGQVLTSQGKIVEGAILEIIDSVSKTPVRAIRSNRVGHFMTVTPLKNGGYELMTEKDGLTFDPIQFQAEGRLIPPIQIKAKA